MPPSVWVQSGTPEGSNFREKERCGRRQSDGEDVPLGIAREAGHRNRRAGNPGPIESASATTGDAPSYVHTGSAAARPAPSPWTRRALRQGRRGVRVRRDGGVGEGGKGDACVAEDVRKGRARRARVIVGARPVVAAPQRQHSGGERHHRRQDRVHRGANATPFGLIDGLSSGRTRPSASFGRP